MKKLILFIGSLLLTNLIVAQAKLGLKVTVYPNFSQVSYAKDGLVEDAFVESMKKYEKSSFSFSGGLGLRWEINKKSSIVVGANYVRTGYETVVQEYGPLDPVEFELPKGSKSFYRYTFLEMPLLFEYSFFKSKRWRLYAVTGPSIWVNLNNRHYDIHYFEDGSDGGKVDQRIDAEYHRTNLTLSGGVGASFELNESFQLLFQPTVQSNLFGMAKKVSLNRRIYNYGLTIGVLYQ